MYKNRATLGAKDWDGAAVLETGSVRYESGTIANKLPNTGLIGATDPTRCLGST